MRTERNRWARLWLPASVAYALAAGLCVPLTWPAAIAVLTPGVALLAVRLRRPVAALPPAARPGPAGAQWWALLAAGVGWELVAFIWGNDSAHPTFSLLVSPLFEHHYPVRVGGYLLWLAVGRWLVGR